MNWQMHLAPTREEAEQRPAESLDWYFNLVMELVPKGPNAPKGYEFMRDLAAAFEQAGGVSVPALQEAGIIILDDPAGTADKIREVRDDIGQQEVFCWMRIGGLVGRERPGLDEAVRRGGHARVPGQGPGRPGRSRRLTRAVVETERGTPCRRSVTADGPCREELAIAVPHSA